MKSDLCGPLVKCATNSLGEVFPLLAQLRCSRLQLLLELVHLRLDNRPAVRLAGVVAVVVLVVTLGFVELSERGDLRDNRFAEILLRGGFGFFGND